MDGARITIIGAGPLGVGLAHRLTQARIRVSFLKRIEPTVVRGSVRENGKTTPFEYERPNIAHLRDTACVFAAVKAFDLESALRQHLPLFTQPIPVISLCNGAVESVLHSLTPNFPHVRFRLGLSTMGVKENLPGQYEISNGRFEWGPLNLEQSATPIESYLFERLPEVFLWHPDPLPAVRKKWLFNVVINSLAGSQRLSRNIELFGESKRLKTAFEEAARLGEIRWGKWPESKASLYRQLRALIEKTSENENSMARDVRLGRRTETEFLAGLAGPHPEFPFLRKLHERLMAP